MSKATKLSAFAAFLFLAAVAPVGLSAQVVTRQIGLAQAGNVFPFATTSMRYQVVYDLAELNVPPGSQLVEIRVRKTQGTGATYNNFRLRIAHAIITSQAGLTTTYDNNYVAPLNTVIGDPQLPGTAPVNYVPVSFIDTLAQEWMKFTFTTPFVYDGVRNMLVDWSYDSKVGTGWQTAGNGRQRNYFSGGNAASVTALGVDTGGNWMVQLDFIVGPTLTATASPGSAQQAAAQDVGPGGNGMVGGTFTIASNNQPGCVLNEIKIRAAGTGNDALAYSSVSVFRDSNADSQFTFGVDTLIGTGVGAFPSDNGVATFTVQAGEASFATSETRRYFVVVKFNGPQLALNGQTFNFVVDDLTVPVGTFKGGVPSATMLGFVIVGPTLNAGALGSAAQVLQTTETGVGGNGVRVGTFTITNNAAGASDLTSISVAAEGSGNDQTAYSQVAVYEDTNANNTWEFGTDPLYGAAAPAFPADNGTLVFSQPQVFAASQLRVYFIVVKLAGTAPALNGQTFNYRISALGTGAGTASAGLPTSVMNGIVIDGPQLTLTSQVGAAQQVLTTAQGTGNNGLLANSFVITANNFGGTSLASVTLQATGTGNDQTAYTQVALYFDANNNGTFEFGTDTLYGTSATAFPADNGQIVFTANQPFNAQEARRYLIVCKFGGTPATNGQTFNFIVQSFTVNAGTQVAGTPTLALNGFQILGPVLAVAATTGAAQPVFANATGAGGNGINVGTFTVTNNASAAATVNTITLIASGTGNDATAFSSVQLFEDTNNNSAWDVGPTDQQVGATLTAYTADNGTATFTTSAAQGAYGVSASKRYFVVVKLAGATLASVNQTFNCAVQALVVSNNAITQGTPSGVMNGLTIAAPSFVFADVPMPQVTTYRTMANVPLQQFTITYPAGPANSISSLTVQSTGSGNDAAAYSSVKLFLDANTNGLFEPATDIEVASVTSFASDNGAATFSLSGPAAQFVATDSRAFFVVGAFNNTPAGGATFQTRVNTPIVAGYAGTTFNGVPAPAAYSAGAQVVLPQFVFADNSGQNIVNAFFGDSGFTLQKFTVSYASGPDNQIATITLSANGTGNDMVDYSAVHLYMDDPVLGTPGTFDPADTLVNSQPAFNANDGQLTFNLSGPASQFIAPQTTQYLVIADFNQLGVNATTFSSTVTDAGGMSFGGQAAGLPQGPSPGLNLLDANLYATFNGPGIATTVNSDSQGINNEGHVICDVSLATGPGSSWNISALTFVGTGTANHAAAYSDLWLYEDDGNGAWDGPNLDSPAASPLASFSVGTFDAMFQLLNTDTGVNSTRRFYLVGRLSGAATTGQTLNARLDSATATPDVGGSVRGVPLVNSSALIIEQTALTVLSGPGTPATLLRKSGTAFVHPIVNVRLGASNNDVTVNGIMFSNAGTGSFAASLSANGFQVWLDDGDGQFTAGDALIFQGAGAASVNAMFSTPVTVANSTVRDLWVVLDVLSTAGNGAAVPLTFQTVINATTDVSAAGGVAVLFGTPAPQSDVLRLVDFFVSNFDPGADLPVGGKDITITGSGFMSPIIVMIDGSICPGTAVINAGTQVTGIQVPPGTGFDVPITIKSGPLATETLTQTFDYVPLQPPKPPGNGNCTASAGSSLWAVGLAPIACLVARYRRRK